MTTLDKIKVWVAVFITVAGIYLSTLELVTAPVPLRFAVFFAALASAGALMYFTIVGQQFIAYSIAAAAEVRKVVWPGREEVAKMTGMVLVFVFIVAMFLLLVDGVVRWLLAFLAR